MVILRYYSREVCIFCKGRGGAEGEGEGGDQEREGRMGRTGKCLIRNTTPSLAKNKKRD